MPQLEHPAITRTLQTGYPEPIEQAEHIGSVDYFGSEIIEGDSVIEDDGEIILEENLQRYLKEVLGFEFKIAE